MSDIEEEYKNLLLVILTDKCGMKLTDIQNLDWRTLERLHNKKAKSMSMRGNETKCLRCGMPFILDYGYQQICQACRKRLKIEVD